MGVTCWVSVLLASQNNNPIKVYSVANYRTQLSHVWANVISTIPTWSLNFCLLFNRAEIWLVLYIFYRSSQDQVNQQNEGYLTVNSALLRSCKSGRDFALGQFYFNSICFSECEHSVFDKPMAVSEPSVPDARLLSLGSKLYPSNTSACSTRILLDSCRVFSRKPKSNKWKKALLA